MVKGLTIAGSAIGGEREARPAAAGESSISVATDVGTAVSVLCTLVNICSSKSPRNGGTSCLSHLILCVCVCLAMSLVC